MFARMLLAFLLGCASCCGQDVTVVGSDGGIGRGVVVKRLEDSGDGYIGLVATAFHVVAARGSIVIRDNGWQSNQSKIVAESQQADVAIVKAWIPNDVKPVEVAAIGEGQEIEVATVRGRFRSLVKVGQNGRWYCDGFLRAGDSGGGVFDLEGRCVGVVSGGWFWIDRDGHSETWPARFGGLKAVLDSIK